MTTAYLVFNAVSSHIFGIYRAEGPEEAIKAMLVASGETVFTVNPANDGYDTITWDSEVDAEGDDGQRAKTRTTLDATEVTAIDGSRQDVLREIESLLGDEGSPEMAEAVYDEGRLDPAGVWYVDSWEEAVRDALVAVGA